MERSTNNMKFQLDVVDETGDTVALATILTMVRKLAQYSCWKSYAQCA